MTTIANKFKLSKKSIFASILFLLLIILGSSSSQAVFIPEGYSSYEYHKLLDFLNLYAGQSKNGDYLTGFNFKPAEPETWTGIIWAEVGPYKHVTSISFNNYQMKGDLDVSGFQALEKLDLRQAQLGEIDARNCPNLKEVNLAMDSLEDILLTDPPLLEKFSISQGSLTSFDFSWAVNLKELAISNIDLITSLDLASNSKLISLSLVLENLESVNFSPSLEKLDISGCENLEVDFSNLSSLKEFACNGLDASTFPLSSLINLENLECQYSSLTSLDLTSLNKLQRLNCVGNYLEELNLASCTKLEYLNCAYNLLQELDLTPCNEASQLIVECENNHLTKIKYNDNLKSIYCSMNFLALSDLISFTSLSGDFYYKPQRSYQLTNNNILHSGELVDLSKEAQLGGKDTVFNWFDQAGNKINPTSGEKAGQFIFAESFKDELVYLEMTNEALAGLTVRSNLARVLSVPKKAIIVQEPEDLTIDEWENAHFTVLADGPKGHEFGYQWEISLDQGASWQAIAGANFARYESDYKEKDSDGEQYRCLVSILKTQNSFPTYSRVATLNVVGKINITQQPRNIGYLLNGDAKFSIQAQAALKDSTLSYQWETKVKDGTVWEEVPAAKDREITIPNCTAEDDYRSYRCIVTETKADYEDSRTSGEAQMIMLEPPTFNTNGNPQPIRRGEGVSGHFSALCSSKTGTDREYVWQKSNDDGANWETIEGENRYVLVLPPVTRDMTDYIYRALVRSSCGGVLSEPVYSEPAAILIYAHFPLVTKEPEDTFTTDGCAVFKVEIEKDPLDAELAISMEGEWQYSVDGGQNWISIADTEARVLSIGSRTYEEHHKSLYRYATIASRAGYYASPVYSEPALLLVMNKPTIDVNPNGIGVAEGDEAVFSVEVTPNGDYEQVYQWQWKKSSDDWNDIPASNSSSLKIIAKAEDDGKAYRVRVKNVYDYGESEEVVSGPASLTVIQKPTIETQPLAMDLLEGERATFSIKASAVNYLAYQWQIKEGDDWQDLKGQTEDELTIEDVNYDDHNGQLYRCLASNIHEGFRATIISDEALLTVVPKPIIIEQPQASLVGENEKVTFKLVIKPVIGSDTIYKWYESTNGSDWTPITTANDAEYVIEKAQLAQHGKEYKCQIINKKGAVIAPSLESDAVSLKVLSRPTISEQPREQILKAGDPASFLVEATINDESSGGQLTYQWQVSLDEGENWANLEGATNNSFEIANAQYEEHNAKQYRCLLTNTKDGAKLHTNSDSALLTVVKEPRFLSHPENISLGIGSLATFNVELEASLGSQQRYQWEESLDEGKTWQAIAGAEEANYVINKVTQEHDGRQFRCQGTNYKEMIELGPLASNIATLTIVEIEAPEIITQPQDQTVVENGQAIFSLEAKIDPAKGALSYQWQVRLEGKGAWSPIEGAKKASLEIEQVKYDEHHANQYKCIVTNTKDGAKAIVESELANLRVIGLPIIENQPQDLVLAEGKNGSFTLKAKKIEESGELIYQWQVSTDEGENWQDIEDAITDKLTLNKLAYSADGNQYRCGVINKQTNGDDHLLAGPVWSDVVSLTLVALPTITSQPKDTQAAIGEEAIFNVAASTKDQGELSYQWQLSIDKGANWNDITGAQSSSYSLDNVQEEDYGQQYRVLVYNSRLGIKTEAVISSPVTLISKLAYKINIIKPTSANDETNPLNTSTGSLVIANITGDLEAIKSLTIQIDTGDELELEAKETIYYLIGTNLGNGEHTITIRLVDNGDQEEIAQVIFFWENYRRGFGFGRFDFD